jgi:hypothetical protein
VKTKPICHIEVVQDDNNELTMGDDVFQLGELVDPYRVSPSNDLEKISNFHIAEKIFIDVNIEELNDVLTSSGQTQIDEYDRDEINI